MMECWCRVEKWLARAVSNKVASSRGAPQNPINKSTFVPARKGTIILKTNECIGREKSKSTPQIYMIEKGRKRPGVDKKIIEKRNVKKKLRITHGCVVSTKGYSVNSEEKQKGERENA